VKSKARIQLFATRKIMADDSNEEETGSQQTNGSYKRGAYGLVTTFTNMELEIKAIGSPEQQRR
jgi:hypothetical protein